MGWIRKARETGWRDVSADLRFGATGVLHVRRVGHLVHWRLRDFTAGTAHAFYAPPAGVASPSVPATYPAQTPNADPVSLVHLGRFTRPIQAPALAGGRWWEGMYPLPPGTLPLTALPGEEVA